MGHGFAMAFVLPDGDFKVVILWVFLEEVVSDKVPVLYEMSREILDLRLFSIKRT